MARFHTRWIFSQLTVGVMAMLAMPLAGSSFADDQDVEKGDARAGYRARPVGVAPLSTRLVDDSLHFYKDHDFGGDVMPVDQVTLGRPAGTPQDLPDGLKDSLSSLRWNLPPGVIVVLYEDGGAKGEQFILWGSGEVDALSEFDFDNKASVWQWYYVGGATDEPEHLSRAGAIRPTGAQPTSVELPRNTMHLFVDKNFGGDLTAIDAVTTRPAAALNNVPGEVDDELTSLRWNLPPGVIVVLHQDADGRKQQVAIWGEGELDNLDVWDFNDKVSRWSWFFVGSAPEGIAGVPSE